ncbi:helix-turn-helix transcriptional regulator [Vibrio mediterranei]|jgi:DNA-binding CsgD family transcriptional regulator|uniref:helix-turn-helix transcriptional regulator n=1 Tax=Vibrio mediterranei TaxID=689 RepID=UPI003CE5556E
MNNDFLISESEIIKLQSYWPSLSKQEALCFHLISIGFTRKDIASKLGSSKNSIDKTMYRIAEKLETTIDQLRSIYLNRLLFLILSTYH